MPFDFPSEDPAARSDWLAQSAENLLDSSDPATTAEALVLSVLAVREELRRRPLGLMVRPGDRLVVRLDAPVEVEALEAMGAMFLAEGIRALFVSGADVFVVDPEAETDDGD